MYVTVEQRNGLWLFRGQFSQAESEFLNDLDGDPQEVINRIMQRGMQAEAGQSFVPRNYAPDPRTVKQFSQQIVNDAIYHIRHRPDIWTQREYESIWYRLGLDRLGDNETWSMFYLRTVDQTGEVLGVTGSRVSDLNRQALRKMREAMNV